MRILTAAPPLAGLFSCFAAACAGPRTKEPLRPVDDIELPRYMGAWRITACMDNAAERDFVDAVETYALRDDGNIGVNFRWRDKSFTAPEKHRDFIGYVSDIGYLHWSLFDNYEWGSFTPRFGLYSLDYARGLDREPVDPWGDEPARGFVKEVVAIAPPASKGKRGSGAKKAGEGAIIADLERVMVAAARKKGVTLGNPAEIHKRLRDPHTRFRIILTNAVKYVTNIESYDRRIQSAINIQGRKMQRRAEFLLTRALRKAGWK